MHAGNDLFERRRVAVAVWRRKREQLLEQRSVAGKRESQRLADAAREAGLKF